MKTIQKTTWMLYLFIGLIINCNFLQSCRKGDVERTQDAIFVYENQTSHLIILERAGTITTFMPNTVTSFNVTEYAGKETNEFSYKRNPFDFYKDDKYVSFDRTKCLDLSILETNNPSNLRHYKAEKLSERKYKFTYTFTEADYNRAVNCP